jgi:hypothetical protein
MTTYEAATRLPRPTSFLDEVRGDEILEKRFVNLVARFFTFARLTIDLVRQLNSEHLERCAAVARQYLDALSPEVLTFESPKTRFEQERDALVEGIRGIRDIGFHPMNLFEVAFHALASTVETGMDFAQAAQDPRFTTWLQAAHATRVRPAVVAFDVCHRLAGTSVPKWKKLPALTKWERHIRLEAMNPAIRADYAQLREVIRKNQTTWAGLSPSKQVDAARELLSRNPPLLYKVTANHTWIAYQLRQELLEYIDPCATCRVVHCSTNQCDVQKEPHAIGENWGDVDDPC